MQLLEDAEATEAGGAGGRGSGGSRAGPSAGRSASWTNPTEHRGSPLLAISSAAQDACLNATISCVAKASCALGLLPDFLLLGASA